MQGPDWKYHFARLVAMLWTSFRLNFHKLKMYLRYFLYSPPRNWRLLYVNFLLYSPQSQLLTWFVDEESSSIRSDCSKPKRYSKKNFPFLEDGEVGDDSLNDRPPCEPVDVSSVDNNVELSAPFTSNVK